MEPKEFLEELSNTALPPVTASRLHARPLELSSRPAWFDAVVNRAVSAETTPGLPNASRPAQDEWGMFDPDQCGFQALFEKLDAIAEVEKPK